jgi:hypothetical protein
MRRAGQHYPGIYGAMRTWFPDDAACLDYLDWLPGVVLSHPRGHALSQGAWCFHQRAVRVGRWKRWSDPLVQGLSDGYPPEGYPLDSTKCSHNRQGYS